MDGNTIAIEPQVFNVIVYLIENNHRVVSRQELLDKIWKERVVSDSSITNHIKSARKVLNDDGIKQNIIKTVHGRGYQFVCKLENTTSKSNLNLWFVGLFLLGLFFSFNYYQKYRLLKAVKTIAEYQAKSYTTFVAQANRRNELVDLINSRLDVTRDLQYEKYFSNYFKQLNEEEKFIFAQIRAMTETGLYQNNFKVVDTLSNHSKIFEQIEGTQELYQHLSFWLNKYHSVFNKRQDMCLLYVGVEDGLPYPSEVNQNIKLWLEQH